MGTSSTRGAKLAYGIASLFDEPGDELVQRQLTTEDEIEQHRQVDAADHDATDPIPAARERSHSATASLRP